VSVSTIDPTPRTAGPLRDRDLDKALVEFGVDAHRLLDADLPDPDGQSFGCASALITTVAKLCVEELRAARRRSGRTTALSELAMRGAQIDGALRSRDLRRRRAALAGVETALGRLRSISTPDDIADAVCGELVRSCGFSRAMLSRVTDGVWRPASAHFAHRAISESDRLWMASVEVPLSAMVLERELLEAGRPAFVINAQDDPRSLREFVVGTGTSSYVVAPIVPAGRVIGLIHADFFPSSREVDDVDAHLLGAFADGFGRIYERAVLLERLKRERDHVRQTLKSTEQIMDNLARAEVELVRHADERSSASAATTLAMTGGSAEIDELLTAREREVMGLLVTGQTNGAIAERLVISEGTVKSHVKQILRKLGAVNRSEVIARYLGMSSQG
jgi:LuxR family transcriptional regulator, regulator of acetate metabolism